MRQLADLKSWVKGAKQEAAEIRFTLESIQRKL